MRPVDPEFAAEIREELRARRRLALRLFVRWSGKGHGATIAGAPEALLVKASEVASRAERRLDELVDAEEHDLLRGRE